MCARVALKQYSLAWKAFKVMQNFPYNLHVIFSGCVHKLRKLLYGKAYIRRVLVKYIGLPIMLLNLLWSCRISPYLVNLKFEAIGVKAGLQFMNPVSFNMSKMYFCCDKLMPIEDLANSRPKKIFGIVLDSEFFIEVVFYRLN